MHKTFHENPMKRFPLVPAVLFSFFLFGFTASAEDVFRIGIIGTTTSHVPAFVKILNDPNASEPCKGFKVVAAYPGGMPDNPDSWNRVRKFSDEIEKQGVQIHGTVESMLADVDGVLLESVDGRPHLEQAKPVIAAGKPLFVDKPMAGSLADVIAIFRLAEENDVPIFSASSLRFSSGFQKARNGEGPAGKVLGCAAWSPCSLNASHPDLFWYGVHGVETLFTIMGPGCETVTRTQTDGTELVVGVWKDGRIGTFRGLRKGKTGYGAVVFGDKGIGDAGSYEGYKALVEEICKFFRTGKSPVEARETIEMFAFMEAADRSKAGGDGAALKITLRKVIEEAEKEISVPVKIHVAADGTVSLQGKEIKLDSLAGELDALVRDKANHRVKVILDSEKGAPIETVQKTCKNLGKATLANYLYEY